MLLMSNENWMARKDLFLSERLKSIDSNAEKINKKKVLWIRKKMKTMYGGNISAFMSGSQVRGTADEFSDYDMFVLVDGVLRERLNKRR